MESLSGPGSVDDIVDAVDAFERCTVAARLRTFECNTIDDLVVAERRGAFFRNPRPLLLAADTGMGGKANNKILLFAVWECLLAAFAESHLFNGTLESARAFRAATGLTVRHFAQGFLEMEGSSWAAFHATTSGRAVVAALVKCWARKAAQLQILFPTFPKTHEDVPIRLVDAKYGHQRRAALMIELSPQVNGIVVRTSAPNRLMTTLHPVAPRLPVLYIVKIRLRFINHFHRHLLFNDHAIEPDLFNTRSGQTTGDFARTFLRDRISTVTPVSSEDETVDAMVSYWTWSMQGIRNAHRTRQEARTAIQEKWRGLRDMTNEPEGEQETEEIGGGDPLVRITTTGQGDAKTTVVPYKRFSQLAGGLGFVPAYKTLRCIPQRSAAVVDRNDDGSWRGRPSHGATGRGGVVRKAVQDGMRKREEGCEKENRGGT